MRRGIDVSTYQGDINWAEVKADGIDFAMIKATQGRSESSPSLRNFTDSKFAQNIVGAHRWGVEAGVYHYLTAKTVSEAMEEAKLFLDAIAPYRSIVKLYAAVDVESKHLPTDKTLLTQIVFTFCSRVEAEGYDPIIYTNLDWMANRLNNITAYPLWLALWRNQNNVPSVEKYPNLRIWQWGSETVPGISGDVDSNFMVAEKPVEKEEPPKTDAEIPSAWAAEAFSWARENGILLGDGNGEYRPHDALTREEACLIAKRVYDVAVEDAAAAVARRLAEAFDAK